MNEFKKYLMKAYTLPDEIDESVANAYINQSCKNNIERIWQLCFRDLRNIDLSKLSPEIFAKLTFSKETIIKKADEDRFKINNIIKLAKNNYFGIDKLNEIGVKGAGIHVAVLDQGLKVNDKIFKKNVIMHTDNKKNNDSMHANAVVDTIYKIIPEATIHFYSEDFDNLTESRFEALEHIIEYNKNAVEKEKIKVISVSAGILNQFKKPPEMLINRLKKIKEDFKKDGCVIVDSNEYAKFFSIASPKYNKQFTGVLDWEYGEEWINRYKERYKEVIEKKKKENILVPGGGRLYAIPGQKTEYVYCGSASYSWSIPCVAAMIAMLKTKNKDLLLEDFFELALQKCDYSDDGWRVINLNTMYKGCF